MPALEVDNCGLMRLVWSRGGVPFAVNVIGFSGTASSPVTQAKATTAAAALAANYTTSGLGAQQHPTVSLTSIGFRSIDAPSQPEFLGVFTATTATGTGNPLPPQVAYVVTARTALAGARFRGRTYIPGFSSNANDTAGVATAAAKTASVAFCNAFNTALATGTWTAAVISRPVYSKDGTVPPVLLRPGLFTTITLYEGRDLVWDTQRRRAIPGI